MQTSARSNHLDAGAQPKMIGVAQNDARIEIIFQRFKAHALDGARRANRHEDGRLDGSAPSGENPARASPSRAITSKVIGGLSIILKLF